jgi:hypothetical protein
MCSPRAVAQLPANPRIGACCATYKRLLLCLFDLLLVLVALLVVALLVNVVALLVVALLVVALLVLASQPVPVSQRLGFLLLARLAHKVEIRTLAAPRVS